MLDQTVLWGGVQAGGLGQGTQGGVPGVAGGKEEESWEVKMHIKSFKIIPEGLLQKETFNFVQSLDFDLPEHPIYSVIRVQALYFLSSYNKLSL